MRYVQAEDVLFTAFDGREVIIKDLLPPVLRARHSVTVVADDKTMLDEIASRKDMYGPGSESMAYLIFDENAADLFEARFNVSVLGKLRVPS